MAIPVPRDEIILRARQDLSVRLPVVFGIGFVGSVEADQEQACSLAINRLLEQQKAVPDRTLYANVTLATTSDLFCADCCLALDIPLQVFLPTSLEELKANIGTRDWTRFDHAMNSALGVRIVGGKGTIQEQAYECGIAVVEQSDMVIALRAASSRPDVAELIEFASATRRWVVQVQNQTEEVEHLVHGRVQTGKAELDFLNRLPSLDVEIHNDSPLSRLRAWQAKLSANAGTVAPKVRRLAAIPILCTSVAAVISGAAPRMQWKLLWTGLGAVLGLVAALLPKGLRLERRQALWVRIRTAAEVTRSIQALWDAPMPYDVVGPEILPELSRMVLSLNLLKAMGPRDAQIGVRQFIKQYRDERVANQMRYFSGQASQAAARGQRYRRISTFCIAVAVLTSAAAFAGHLLLHLSESAWIGLLTSMLFQAATVAGALRVVQDCDRREIRYQEMHQSLRTMDVELGALRTWPLVHRMVNKIERALLVELIEWRSLLQNRKLPRS